MKSSTFSASNTRRLPPTKPSTWLVSDPLTKSEIALLQQGKKSIADFVQKELPERLKARQQEHMLYKA